MRGSRHHPVNAETHVGVYTQSFSLRLANGQIRNPERPIAALLKELLEHLNTRNEFVDQAVVDVTVFVKKR